MFKTSHLYLIINVVCSILTFFGVSEDTRVRVYESISKVWRTANSAYVNACYYSRIIFYSIGLFIVALVFGLRYGIFISLKFHAELNTDNANHGACQQYIRPHYSRITIWRVGRSYFSDLLETMLHELRHAYQHNYNKSIFTDYVQPEADFNNYYNHPAEVDACNYAATHSYAWLSMLKCAKRAVILGVALYMVSIVCS